MLVKLVTAPLLEPVTLQEAKDQLRLDTAIDDTQVTAAIGAARELAERECWRGFVTQTWEVVTDKFPDEVCRPASTRYDPAFDGLELPRGKLAAIDSVKYIDGAGVQQTMSASDYVADSDSEPGRLRLGYGKAWPAHREQWDAVRVRYTVGWAVADVPKAIKAALLLLVEKLYDNPEVDGEMTVGQLSPAADSLLRPFRLVRET